MAPPTSSDASRSLAAWNSYLDGPLLAGPMVGEVGETFARVWAQARDEATLTLTVHGPGGDRRIAAAPRAAEWLCVVFHVDGLEPGQAYEYSLSSVHGATERQRLPFAPPRDARRLQIAFGSCFLYHDRPAPILDAAREGAPDVFVMAGDNCYYLPDEWESEEAMMLAQLRARNNDALRRLAASIPVLGIWDDHDFGPNDSDGTFAHKATSLRVFRRVWAQRSYGTSETAGVFSTVRLGPVELFLTDDRYYRAEGEQILGAAQLAWLEERLLASDAPVKVIVSGSQVLPEAAVKLEWECWRRDAPDELARLASFIEERDIHGVVLASGDVHLGYLLRAAGRPLPGMRVGSDLWELTSSPLANDVWDQTVQSSGLADRFIVHELESANYGVVDVDLDRAGHEVHLVLRDADGATLLDQPIALSSLRARPITEVNAPAPAVVAAPPIKLCPLVWNEGKAYFFEGERYVRYDLAAGRVDPDYPRYIASTWRGLWPAGVDAAVLWTNGKAYFFKGSRYLAYDVAADRADPGPRDIAVYWRGLWPTGVDAAVLWNDGKAYFFKGSEYVRYDVAADRADPGYPRPIAASWRGLWPDGVDAAFLGHDGKAYFFKGSEYIRYDVAADRADPGYPRPIEERWPGLFAVPIDVG